MWILQVMWFFSAGMGLVLPYHPNMCNPQHRKSKDCLQVRKKMSRVSGKPGPLGAFQGKKLVFASFTLDKLWVLTNTPGSAVLSLLCCFMIMQLCRSYPRQLRAPEPTPCHGQLPHHSTSLGRCLWMQLCSSACMAWTGQLLFCPDGSGWWQMDVKVQLIKMVLKFGLANTAGDKMRG